MSGGKRGIRTLEGFQGPTRFPVVRLRPAQPSFHSSPANPNCKGYYSKRGEKCQAFFAKTERLALRRFVAHKAAQLVRIAHAKVERLAAQRGVKFRHRRLVVGLQEQIPDAKRQRTQEAPADERKVQHKRAPLFALHHVAAQLHRAAGGQVRVFRQQIGDLAVAVAPVNARYDDKAAQKDFKGGQKLYLDDVEVRRAEGGYGGGDGRGRLAALHKITAAA